MGIFLEHPGENMRHIFSTVLSLSLSLFLSLCVEKERLWKGLISISEYLIWTPELCNCFFFINFYFI